MRKFESGDKLIHNNYGEGRILEVKDSFLRVEFKDKIRNLDLISLVDNNKIKYQKEFSPFIECVSRHFENIIHFTSIYNIISILEHGLLSRDRLNKNNVLFHSIDLFRNHKKSDCVSFFLEFPNEKLLEIIKKNSTFENQLCLIILDSKMLFDFFDDTYFYSYNALSSGIPNVGGKTKGDLNDFLNMFSSNFYTRYKNKEGKIEVVEHKRDELLPKRFTSSIQAEVYVNESIPSKYIKKIVFQNELSLSRFKKRYPVIRNIILDVNPLYFGKRKQYILQGY